jgi:hypothetical protein
VGAWLAATTSTSVVALRIGYLAETRPDPATTGHRDRSARLSPRDAAELVRAAVEQFRADGVEAARDAVHGVAAGLPATWMSTATPTTGWSAGRSRPVAARSAQLVFSTV